jgi:U3 small nucleolar RNA-associated protein 5
MEYSRPLISITSDGSLLAIINGGREVCVWDATNGKQICKISNSTWSAVLSLVWAPSHSKAPIGTRKKRKRLTNPSPGTPSLIAIGSNRGLVVWDVIRNEEHVTMPEDGCGGVVSSYWNGPDSLYMCDGSKEAFYWSIGKDSLDRWKADKRGVSCITMRSHGDVILTAGKSIKLWDSTNHMLIKRFSGHHFTDIFSMSFVTPIHFISAAVNDRYICLWNSETGSATSLVCEKDLMAVHSTCEDNEQEMIKIVSVCQDGLLHLYTLESHNHKVASDPILPSTTIQFVQDGKSQQVQYSMVMSGHHDNVTLNSTTLFLVIVIELLKNY